MPAKPSKYNADRYTDETTVESTLSPEFIDTKPVTETQVGGKKTKEKIKK